MLSLRTQLCTRQPSLHSSKSAVHMCNPIIRLTLTPAPRWSSGGSRLVSGDQNGMLCVWNVTQHGHIINTPIRVFERNSPIAHCLINSPNFTPETNSGSF